MDLFSLVASATLFALASIPVGPIASPVRAGTIAWAIMWAANGLLGGSFVQSYDVLIYVFLGNLLFLAGGGLIAWPPSHRLPSSLALSGAADEALRTSYRARAIAAWGLFGVGLAGLEIGLRQTGSNGIASLFGAGGEQLFELLRLSKSALVDGGEWAIPPAISVSTAALSAMALLVGVDLRIGKMHRRAWLGRILSLAGCALLAAGLSVGLGTRSFLIIAGFLVIGGWLAASAFTSRDGRVVRPRHLFVILGVVGAFVIWVVIVQSARRQDFSLQNVSETLEYLRTWAAGYLPALGQWFHQQYDPSTFSLGSNLLQGLLGPLGFAPSGTDSPIAAVAIGNDASSNAMTMFRVVWLDFGVLGGSIGCLLAGIGSQFVYIRAMKRGGPWLAVLAAVYAALAYSVNYWFFAYGARVVGVVFATLILGISMRGYGRESVVGIEAAVGRPAKPNTLLSEGRATRARRRPHNARGTDPD